MVVLPFVGFIKTLHFPVDSKFRVYIITLSNQTTQQVNKMQTKQNRSEYLANLNGFQCAPVARKAYVKASKASGFTLGGIVQGFAGLVVVLTVVHYFF